MNVYILKQGDYYKIGKANDIHKRIKQLQTAAPLKIEYVASLNLNNIKKSLDVESEIHRTYNKYKSYGEWFKLKTSHVDTIINRYQFIQDDTLLKIQTEDVKNYCQDFQFMYLIQMDFYFKVENQKWIFDKNWDSIYTEIKETYGESLFKHILLLGNSYKNFELIIKIFYCEKLSYKEINYIKSFESKKQNYNFNDIYLNFVKLIFKYHSLENLQQLFPLIIKYKNLLQYLCFDNNTRKDVSDVVYIIKNVKNIKLIELLNKFNGNKRTKSIYLKKLIELLKNES